MDQSLTFGQQDAQAYDIIKRFIDQGLGLGLFKRLEDVNALQDALKYIADRFTAHVREIEQLQYTITQLQQSGT